MSLAATHIRFSLATKDKYKIKNLEQYISGAVYPDSRYVTNIDRNLTHNEDLLAPGWANTDFKKGWQSHFVCDVMFNKTKRVIFPEVNFKKEGCEKDWIISSAIKIIQDIDDMQNFFIQDYLGFLNYTENPNGEDLNKVKESNQLIKTLYLNKKICTVEEYGQLYKVCGISDDLVYRIVGKARELSTDKNKVKKIKSIYSLMLNLY
jgi:hypothetical protein